MLNETGTRGAREGRAREAIFEARALLFPVVLRLQVQVALSRQQQERSVRGKRGWRREFPSYIVIPCATVLGYDTTRATTWYLASNPPPLWLGDTLTMVWNDIVHESPFRFCFDFYSCFLFFVLVWYFVCFTLQPVHLRYAPQKEVTCNLRV